MLSKMTVASHMPGFWILFLVLMAAAGGEKLFFAS